MYYTIINNDFCYFFVSPSFSQGVTNQSTVDLSIINGSKKNGSGVTVINAVNINCFDHLEDRFKGSQRYDPYTRGMRLSLC